MNKEDYDKMSTFDKIEYDIDMQIYMEHNGRIASIYDHLGEVYGYQDLEDAKQFEQNDTLILYKKALKEKCNAIDKAIKYIKQMRLLERSCYEIQQLLNILQGDDKE
jgi:SepF-like predicted cell division protein (DUF552 family)